MADDAGHQVDTPPAGGCFSTGTTRTDKHQAYLCFEHISHGGVHGQRHQQTPRASP